MYLPSPVYKGVLNNWHGQDSQEHDMDPLDLDPPLTPENPFARSLPSENNTLARSLPNATRNTHTNKLSYRRFN